MGMEILKWKDAKWSHVKEITHVFLNMMIGSNFGISIS